VELLGYAVEPLRNDQEFVLHRGHTKEAPSVPLLTTLSLRPAPETLKKMEHEYSLRNELESAWAVRPLALSEHRGQMSLVLEDPGGETLDRFVRRPMEITQFLRLVVNLAAALCGLHKKHLIHKDLKPANVVLDPATDRLRLLGFGIVARSILAEVERGMILRVLENRNWMIGGAKGAAAELGLKRTALIYKMKRLGVSRSVRQA